MLVPMQNLAKRSLARLYLLLVILMFYSVAGVAQEAATEPAFVEVFFRLDAGKLAPLERETAFIQGKASGFIVMNTKATSEFSGAKSPVRFHSDQPLDFVVRSALAPSAVDPKTLYVLRKLNSKKKSRELVIMAGKFSPLGGSTTTDRSQGALPVTFARYGASSIKMTTGPLPPGEYTVSRLYGQTAFCFGVD
jgi:hypothetical protein